MAFWKFNSKSLVNVDKYRWEKKKVNLYSKSVIYLLLLYLLICILRETLHWSIFFILWSVTGVCWALKGILGWFICEVASDIHGLWNKRFWVFCGTWKCFLWQPKILPNYTMFSCVPTLQKCCGTAPLILIFPVRKFSV